MTCLSLFYADDSASDIHSWERFIGKLSNIEISLHSVRSVEDAIPEFNQNEFDAALIDWNLFDGEGTEIAEYIRSLDSSFPIIFLSGIFLDEKIHEAALFKPLACIQKGATTEYMEQAIQLVKGKVFIGSD